MVNTRKVHVAEDRVVIGLLKRRLTASEAFNLAVYLVLMGNKIDQTLNFEALLDKERSSL